MLDPLTIGTIGMGLFKAGTNFFDNSANEAAHEQNKARVAQIDQKNQLTHFNNLSIRSRALNRQANLNEQLYNIDTAQSQRLANRRLDFDRATQDSLLENQDDLVNLYRSMSGPSAGKMNIDSSMLAQIGRASAFRRNRLMRSKDNLITSGYLDQFQSQNQRGQAIASANQPTIYQQYIQDYTPVKSGSSMTNKLLGLAGDLGSTAMDSLKMHNSLKPPETGDQIFDMDLIDWGNNG